MFDQPILVYSSYCNYSVHLLENLLKNHRHVYDNIVRMNIDVDPDTGKRPQIFEQIQKMINKRIDRVPTLILENTRLLNENAITDWVNSQNQQQEVPQSPFGVPGFEMTGNVPGPRNDAPPGGVPGGVPGGLGDFGSPLTGMGDNLAGTTQTLKVGNLSEKKLDTDSRLEKLLSERKQLDNNFKQQRF